jgi:hypothetical protein
LRSVAINAEAVEIGTDDVLSTFGRFPVATIQAEHDRN